MNFFKTSFWASASTGVAMLCGLITTKYVAVMLGPQGMAYIGQFSNSVVLLALFASAACTSGVVKYVAEHQDKTERQNIISSAATLILVATLLVSIICILFSNYLAKWVFNDPGFFDVFLYFGFLVIFPTINGFVGAILNGLGQIRTMAVLNIITAIINVSFVVAAAKWVGIKGVLLANTAAAAFVCIVYLFVLNKKKLLPSLAQIKAPDKKVLQLLLGFSLMSIVSGVLAPMIQLFIRTKLLYNFDAPTAGLWQANIRLSDYYLNFFYIVMGVYYLPKLSALKGKNEIKREIVLGYGRILPIVIFITLCIWFFRDYIIRYFLTQQFEGMLILLKWQLIGDVIKISSWILGYVVVAKAMKKLFIATEIVFAILLVLLTYILVNRYGLLGTVYAFVLNYVLYLLTMVLFLRKYLK